MTIANPLVKRCYTMSEPHLSGHRVILGFNTMKEAQDAHDFIANIRPSPADSPCQSAGAVAPGECGSVPTDSQILQKLREVDHAGHIQWAGNPWLKRVVLDFARAVLGMQPPNTAGQPNEQNDVVGEGK